MRLWGYEIPRPPGYQMPDAGSTDHPGARSKEQGTAPTHPEISDVILSEAQRAESKDLGRWVRAADLPAQILRHGSVVPQNVREGRSGAMIGHAHSSSSRTRGPVPGTVEIES